MKMQCILADDEPLARRGMENFIREIPFLELTHSCSNAMQVIEVLGDRKTDLMFLDIHMPKMSGIELMKSLPAPPITIITTAYPNYAIESYELVVLDYLLKPVPFERFVKAVNKAKDYHELLKLSQQGKDQGKDFCFIKCDKIYEKIFYSDINYIEALVNYVVIHTRSKKYITYLTLKTVEDNLPAAQFLKINKSYIVSLEKVERIEGNELTVDGGKLQIGRTFKDHVMEVILNDRLLKR